MIDTYLTPLPAIFAVAGVIFLVLAVFALPECCVRLQIEDGEQDKVDNIQK